jgi:23S rRNA pseudouridine2605 synthase
MRLAKHLAHAGVASRRAAEVLIRDGRISIDGKIITDPARDVDGSERIAVDDELLNPLSGKRVVYAVHKPAGVVSTAHDTHGRAKVTDLVESDHRLYPVGRLDADSTGLILLTDDGDLAHKLTHPSFEVPKTYRVKVRELPVSEGSLRRMREGLQLEDGKTAPANVRQTRPGILEITIHEGKKHQVKRMCEAIGHPVVTLTRIAIGPLRLGDLAVGGVRRLSAAEVQRLRDAAGGE